ncbi:MAG: hypothetical protein E6Q67_01100 [Roseateles sp.]|nr:MAG: hypothetical protein E6Q67_01100 [Roseateles sp.]
MQVASRPLIGQPHALVFISRCREFGFVIEQVRELVGLVDEPERPCVEVWKVAARRLTQLRGKLDDLQAMARDDSLRRQLRHGVRRRCRSGLHHPGRLDRICGRRQVASNAKLLRSRIN